MKLPTVNKLIIIADVGVLNDSSVGIVLRGNVTICVKQMSVT